MSAKVEAAIAKREAARKAERTKPAKAEKPKAEDGEK